MFVKIAELEKEPVKQWQFLGILQKIGHSFTLAEYVMHRKIQLSKSIFEKREGGFMGAGKGMRTI